MAELGEILLFQLGYIAVKNIQWQFLLFGEIEILPN